MFLYTIGASALNPLAGLVIKTFIDGISASYFSALYHPVRYLQ